MDSIEILPRALFDTAVWIVVGKGLRLASKHFGMCGWGGEMDVPVGILQSVLQISQQNDCLYSHLSGCEGVRVISGAAPGLSGLKRSLENQGD